MSDKKRGPYGKMSQDRALKTFAAIFNRKIAEASVNNTSLDVIVSALKELDNFINKSGHFGSPKIDIDGLRALVIDEIQNKKETYQRNKRIGIFVIGLCLFGASRNDARKTVSKWGCGSFEKVKHADTKFLNHQWRTKKGFAKSFIETDKIDFQLRYYGEIKEFIANINVPFPTDCNIKTKKAYIDLVADVEALIEFDAEMGSEFLKDFPHCFYDSEAKTVSFGDILIQNLETALEVKKNYIGKSS